jgi:hypothetical protein
MATVLALTRSAAAAPIGRSLRVTRSAGAEDCPDGARLREAIARVMGRDAFDVTADPQDPADVTVAFGRRGADRVATVIPKGTTGGTRNLHDDGSSCDALANAVAVMIAMVADNDDAPASPSRATATEEAADPTAEEKPAAPAAPAPVTVAPNVSEARWYGWQIAMTDAVAIIGFNIARTIDDPFSVYGNAALAVPSAVVFVAGGPTIHLLHHRLLAAIASGAMRIVLPALGDLIGHAVTPPPQRPAPPAQLEAMLGAPPADAAGGFRFPDNRDTFLGFEVGLLVASAVDVGILAWMHSEAPPAPQTPTSSVQIAPTASLVPQHDGRMAPALGLIGSF